MLFFSYKLVIILGLAVVIYFIYREVDSLHYRLESLENRLNAMDYIKYDFNQDNKNDDNNEITDTLNIKTNTNTNTKHIIIDLNENMPIFNKMDSEYVEIYSNDNSDKNIIYSLSSSSFSEKINNLHNSPENLDKNDSPKSKSKSSPVNSDKNDSPKSKLSPVNSDKNDSPKSKSKLSPVNSDKNDSPKSKSKSSPENLDKNDSPKLTTVNINLDLVPLNLPKNIKSSEDLDISKIKNLTIVELTKIATENNIEVSKLVDGKMKKKLKQELINEIISKKNI